MNVLLSWRAAPPTVKWTTLVFLILIVCGLQLFISNVTELVDVWPAHGIVLITILWEALILSLVILIALSVFGVLVKQPWARFVLQILAWICFAYFSLVGLLTVWNEIYAWDNLKEEATAKKLNPVWALSQIGASYLIPAIIFLTVIVALRARTTRQYCANSGR
jgi:hypothetical protein